ncbi:MAG: transposase [Noviherbaspirillum sp.]|nr:transposase [Noviherbaspirillum sp.]
MKNRLTEEQTIGVLKEAEAGMKVAEVCRKYGISDATYYNWKAKFGGLTVSETQPLRVRLSQPGTASSGLVGRTKAGGLMSPLVSEDHSQAQSFPSRRSQ